MLQVTVSKGDDVLDGGKIYFKTGFKGSQSIAIRETYIHLKHRLFSNDTVGVIYRLTHL